MGNDEDQGNTAVSVCAFTEVGSFTILSSPQLVVD